jgi:tRNA-specific 2-thiouridylase
MGKGERVVVAMSGGVDSSMAAALLQEEGYEVIGVMMRLWAPEGVTNRCCSPEAAEEARRVCQILGVPFYLLNFEEGFKRHVVDYFVWEYGRGRTPNPCLECNRHLKFGLLFRKALALGAAYLATGHYARARKTNGRYQLLKGVDRAKDQSYALYMLGQEELAHLLLPLGGYTKQEVRSLARKMRLPVAEKAESQELCFVPEGGYGRFLRDHRGLKPQPGPIIDLAGSTIGEHKGLPYYTIGQRRGLGIAAREPLYVLRIDLERNALVVGRASALRWEGLLARDTTYVSGEAPPGPMEVTAKIRYKAKEAEALLNPLEGRRARLTFLDPQRGVAPGQGAVFYQGEVVIGGGIIEVGV